MDPDSEAARRIGEVLRGKWKLEKVIGVGGMAAVYAATHRNGMRGAVKLLHPEYANDPESRERFLREGYVANRVERGAVKVLDDDTTDDGSVYLVMELLTGETTDEIAQRRPKEQLSLPEVVWVGQALLDVLVQAHAVGIVHRDIKPENLFICTNGELRVLDFGIARLRDGKAGSVKKTNTTNAMGTPAFMPAEQALADWERVGPRSDLYSAGATLFTLLTGELTHSARTAQELMISVATKPARPLQTVMPSVPAGIAAVVDRACAFRPDDRFPDARSMRAALDAAARGIHPHPPGQPHAGSVGGAELPGKPREDGYGQGGLSAPANNPAPMMYAQTPFAQPASNYGHQTGPIAPQGYAPQAPMQAGQAYAQYPQSARAPVQGYGAQPAAAPNLWNESSSVTGPISAPVPSHPQPNSAANVKVTMRVDPRAAQEAYMPSQWNTASGGTSPAAHLAKSRAPKSNAKLILVVLAVVLAAVLVALIVVLATR